MYVCKLLCPRETRPPSSRRCGRPNYSTRYSRSVVQTCSTYRSSTRLSSRRNTRCQACQSAERCEPRRIHSFDLREEKGRIIVGERGDTYNSRGATQSSAHYSSTTTQRSKKISSPWTNSFRLQSARCCSLRRAKLLGLVLLQPSLASIEAGECALRGRTVTFCECKDPLVNVLRSNLIFLTHSSYFLLASSSLL